LGAATWVPAVAGRVWNIARTRVAGANSLGVITTPGDEELGLSSEEISAARLKLARGEVKDRNTAARRSRRSSNGLLILYPISRYSGHDDGGTGRSREPLFADPDGPLACDLIGLALSFPPTKQSAPAEAYLEGTARWLPAY